MFYDVMQAMNKFSTLDKVGFYVADSRFFKEFTQTHPKIESGAFYLVKEWEIVRDSHFIKPDIQKLKWYEEKIGRTFLWNALVADRRIYFGKKYAYSQDYRPRFNHERMLALLQTGLERMEKLFDELQPDFVVSFQCVTIGEYLSYLFAKARNIPVLNLRPTRIQNYFYAGESVLEPSLHLRKVYDGFIKDGITSDFKNNAIEYLREVRDTHAMYEGVVPASNKPPVTVKADGESSTHSKVLAFIKLFIEEYRYRFGELRFDNHVSGYIGPMVSRKIIRPLRAKFVEKQLGNPYVGLKDLSRLDYAFFPLHTEPEITLSVYSKSYLNQIEAARLFSHNLPVGMNLVIKEHPWAIGKRPVSYYRKLLNIPNVMLAHPWMKSRELVSSARLITVIAGSIGFEGLTLTKQVVVLGRAPFNFLPSNMIRHVTSPDKLAMEVADLLANHEHDETALISFIAATMQESVPIDFYTRLLGRTGAYNPDIDRSSQNSNETRMVHVRRLAGYLDKRLNDFKPEHVHV